MTEENNINEFANAVTEEGLKSIRKAICDRFKDFAGHLIEAHPELKDTITEQKLIELWNAHSDLKLDVPEVKVPRTRNTNGKKCTIPISKGDRKGEPCGKNCAEGKDTCSAHAKKSPKKAESESTSENTSENAEKKEESSSESSNGCQHELSSGKNKGKACGKPIKVDGKWCTTHGKKHGK